MMKWWIDKKKLLFLRKKKEREDGNITRKALLFLKILISSITVKIIGT